MQIELEQLHNEVFPIPRWLREGGVLSVSVIIVLFNW